MSNFILPALQFLFEGIDTFRGQQQADRLNRLGDQGRDILKGVPDAVRSGTQGAADTFYNRATESNNDAFAGNTRAGNAFLSSFFNVPQSTEKKGPGLNPTDQAIDNRNAILANAQIGNSQLVQGIKSAGADTLAATKDAFQGAEQQYSKNEALTGQLRNDRDVAVGEAKQNFTDLKSAIQATRDAATAGYTDVIKNIVDQTARLVSGAAHPIMSAASQAIARLSSQKTGDPARDAQIDQQINATRAMYASQATDAVATANSQFAQTAGAIRNTAYNTYLGALTTSDATQRQALSDFNGTVNQANATFASGATTLAGYNTQIRTAEAETYSQVLNNIFTATTGGLSQSAAMLDSATKWMAGMESEHAAQQIAIEGTYGEMATNSVLNWAGAQSAYAGSLINANYDFVSWATPFSNLNQNLSNIRAQQAQQDALNQQRDYNNFALGLGTVGAIGGLGTGIGNLATGIGNLKSK